MGCPTKPLEKLKWMISGFDLLNNEHDKSSHSVHLTTKQTAAWLLSHGMANSYAENADTGRDS